MKFRFEAFDRAGASRRDVEEAASKAEAMELLRREGCTQAHLFSPPRPAADVPKMLSTVRARFIA